MFAHFAGQVSQDLVLVVQLDSEHRTRKNSGNSAFELNRFFAAHGLLESETKARREMIMNQSITFHDPGKEKCHVLFSAQ